MDNKIAYTDRFALVNANHAGQHQKQMPVYLIVDWQTGEITAEAMYFSSGTPAHMWNGYSQAFKIPGNVDASKLSADINEMYIDRLNTIKDEWYEQYDGQRNVGKLRDCVQEQLSDLERELEDGTWLTRIEDDRMTDYLVESGIIDEDGN